jgi:hypothetical protein
MKDIHFIASGSVTAATNYPLFEIWNAAASGLDVLIYSIVINTTGSSVLFKSHTAAQGSTAKTLANKQLGGTAPTFTFKGDDIASPAGTTRGTIDVVENTDKVIEFITPLIVEPGIGFTISDAAIQKTVNILIEGVQRDRRF